MIIKLGEPYTGFSGNLIRNNSNPWDENKVEQIPNEVNSEDISNILMIEKQSKHKFFVSIK